MTEINDKLDFNGVSIQNGAYYWQSLSPQQIAQMARGQGFRLPQTPPEQLDKGLGFGIDPGDLSQTGWGVIYTHNVDPAIQTALAPLLAWRKSQAGMLYREYAGIHGYLPQDTKRQFLKRNKIGTGPVNPKEMPYYLLLVGSPTEIPFIFQYQMGVKYAVGRIYFDTVAEYAAYAHHVVRMEKQAIKRDRKVAFWGPHNKGDQVTGLSVDHLIAPLMQKLPEQLPDWQLRQYVRDEATKGQLSRLLGGGEMPAFLFTASHGMVAHAHPQQTTLQGALVCQEWQSHTPPTPDQYFSALDLTPDTDLSGMIAFMFACFSAGTPQKDSFAQALGRESTQIAPEPFVAKLPATMLSRGALAVFGHVDLAWRHSFLGTGIGSQTNVFESMILELLDGQPLGFAAEYFDDRYMEITTELTTALEEEEKDPDLELEIAELWLETKDARSYIIIGDPAVKIQA